MSLSPDAPEQAKDLILSYRGKEIGRGQYIENSKQFVVRKGSKVRMAEAASMRSGIKVQRENLLKQGAMVEDGEFYKLTRDVKFSSISNAAVVLLGRSANGNREWQPESPKANSANSTDLEATSSTSSKAASELPCHPVVRADDTTNTAEEETDFVADRYRDYTVSVEIKQRGKVVAQARVKPTSAGRGAWTGEEHDGSIVVLAGSSFRADNTASLAAPYRDLRNGLFGDREYFDSSLDDSGRRILKKHYDFNSLSAAASAVLGTQVNGRNAWTISENRSDSFGVKDAPGDRQDTLNGLVLHLGFIDGSRIIEAIRNGDRNNSLKWAEGPFPVPYVGNSRVANRSTSAEGTVDRKSGFPASAATLLSLEERRHEGSEVNRKAGNANCTRFHLDLRDDPQQFEDAPTSEIVTVIGVEAILDINSTRRRSKGEILSSQDQPLVLVFHLNSDDDIIEGQLAQQLGLWLYGEEALDFRRYLANFIESTTGTAGVEGLIPDDLLSFVTLFATHSKDSTSRTISNQVLLNLASLRAPHKKLSTDSVSAESADSVLGPYRLAEWNGTSRAVFKRSAMAVVDDADSPEFEIADTTAMEASSIYSDVVALTMLEHLSLNGFVKRTQEIANKLLDNSYINDDSNLQHAALLEELQRDYMYNSASYGKLHIVMRANGGDIYRALSVRWRLSSLRSDISEEITRLSEHVGTLANRSREILEKTNAQQQRNREMKNAAELRDRENRNAEELRKREQASDREQRIRESTISTSLAFLAVIIGAPALSDFALALWGWPPLATFIGTCVFAGVGIIALPPLVRHLVDRKENRGGHLSAK